MALPNDSFIRNPDGAGTTFATHLIGGKEYPVGMSADFDGHVDGTLPCYGLWIPPAATAASKFWFDFHNNQASTIVRLRKLFPVVTGAVVTGTFNIESWVSRTTAAGTGGTAAVSESSTPATVASFWRFNKSDAALPAGITARVAPTGGATQGNFLFTAFVATEETNAASGLAQYQNLFPEMPQEQPIKLGTGEGIRVNEAATASPIGTIGWLMIFTVQQ